MEDIEQQLESQLIALYAEKEMLETYLGTSEPEKIVDMIKSMESQLIELYQEKENYTSIDTEIVQIIGKKKVFIKNLEKKDE